MMMMLLLLRMTLRYLLAITKLIHQLLPPFPNPPDRLLLTGGTSG